MTKILSYAHKAVMTFLAWGWPLLLADAALETWAAPSAAGWRSTLNLVAFAYVLCAPVAPISLLLDRTRRERAMARLCGLREGDERERAVTGEAARATLLFGLSLQAVLLVLTLVTVNLRWNPTVPKGDKHGLLSVGLSFSTSRHLNPFELPKEDAPQTYALGAKLPPAKDSVEVGGYQLAPAAFPILALLILIQVAAFKAFSTRKYEGAEG